MRTEAVYYILDSLPGELLFQLPDLFVDQLLQLVCSTTNADSCVIHHCASSLTFIISGCFVIINMKEKKK